MLHIEEPHDTMFDSLEMLRAVLNLRLHEDPGDIRVDFQGQLRVVGQRLRDLVVAALRTGSGSCEEN